MSDFKVVLPTTTEEWQRDMDIAYNKGRADMKKEIEEHSVFYSNRPIEDIVLEARADAINECIKALDEYIEFPMTDEYAIKECIRVLENIKEQK